MKKIIVMGLMTLLMLSIDIPPGHAGSSNKQLVKGVVIGTGAILLGAALVNEIRHDNRFRVVVPDRRGYRHHNRDYRHARSGRMLVGPRYERRWNPGHYNRRGHWVNRQYERVIPGRGGEKHRQHPAYR